MEVQLDEIDETRETVVALSETMWKVALDKLDEKGAVMSTLPGRELLFASPYWTKLVYEKPARTENDHEPRCHAGMRRYLHLLLPPKSGAKSKRESQGQTLRAARFQDTYERDKWSGSLKGHSRVASISIAYPLPYVLSCYQHHEH